MSTISAPWLSSLRQPVVIPFHLFDLVDGVIHHGVDSVTKADLRQGGGPVLPVRPVLHDQVSPHVPPHGGIDFPHLMLRAKAVKFREEGARLRDRLLTSTDTVFKLTSIPLVDITVNAINRSGVFPQGTGVHGVLHHDAPVPGFFGRTLRKQ